MIICHCNLVTDEQIKNAISTIESRNGKLSVVSVLKELNIRFKCGGCFGSYRKYIEIKNLIDKH